MALVLVARAGVEPSLSRLKGGAPHRKRNARVVPRDGIEPPSSVCKTEALPLDERGRNGQRGRIRTSDLLRPMQALSPD